MELTPRARASKGEITVIGIDCAAQPENTGLARAVFNGENLTILDSCCASRRTSAASIAAGWARETRRALFAFDAPLGWPQPFTRALADHRAGEPLAPAAHAMFRRMTDDAIHAQLQKRPMEVAADRIARAHSALRMLGDLREPSYLISPSAFIAVTTDGRLDSSVK